MAELPEISKLAGQMGDTLSGKTIQSITLLQENVLISHLMSFKNGSMAPRLLIFVIKGSGSSLRSITVRTSFCLLVWAQIFYSLMTKKEKLINTR